jgi:hypothetical protein
MLAKRSHEFVEVIDSHSRFVRAGVDAVAASDAEVRIHIHGLRRGIVAKFNRANANAAMAVDALLGIHLDYGSQIRFRKEGFHGDYLMN